jgi:hypothetical protein
MERGPIYVAGLERSGTSLMYALLASHPNLAMTRRTNLWKHFYGQYGDLQEPKNLRRCLDMMRRYKRLAVLEPDFDRLERDFLAGPRTYPRLFDLLESQYAERVGRPRWGDKSLNTEQYADAIFAAYPGARILHMIRDPRDRFASSFTRWGVRRGGVGAGTAEWLSSVRVARRNQRRHPSGYRMVRYESLAAEPEASLREICAFIGEPFTPQMLSMEGAQVFRDKGSNSSYERRDPGVISTGSIGRYRQVLSPRQIAFIQVVAKDEMAAFGYRADALGLGPRQRLGFAIRDVPIESAHLLVWRTREAFRDRAGRPVPAYRLLQREEAA